MIKIEEYDIKNTIKCDCGYEFTINDMTDLRRINKEAFYSNVVKHYSQTKCPNCNKETLLFLKQVGQTYKVIDIAINNNNNEENITTENVTTSYESQNKEETSLGNELICPVCKKECKSLIGLNSHMKTHNK